MKNYTEALQIIEEAVSSFGTEEVDVRSANGVIADDIFSSQPVPSFSNSAMDGYCLKSSITDKACSDNHIEFQVKGSIFAGDEPPSNIKDFDVYEIMTGAKMPDDMDTVLPVEKGKLIEKDGSKFLLINEPVKKNANVRKSGEDFQKDDLILSKRSLINDHHKIGMIMNNISSVKAFRKPLIGILTTGNELNQTSSSSIPNSNGPFLESAVQSMGLECTMNVHAEDQINLIINQIQKLKDSGANIILTSGGVSAGKADFIPAALTEMGAEILFHKLWIRPGKPVLMAKFPNGQIVFGLPGNPVSVAVGFRFLAAQAIRIAQGRKLEKPITSKNLKSYKKSEKFCLFAKAIAHVLSLIHI